MKITEKSKERLFFYQGKVETKDSNESFIMDFDRFYMDTNVKNYSPEIVTVSRLFFYPFFNIFISISCVTLTNSSCGLRTSSPTGESGGTSSHIHSTPIPCNDPKR